MKGKRIISTLVLLLLAWAFAPQCAAEPRVKFDHKSMNIHMDITMEFPHYYLSFTDVCWEDMDTLFKKYFAQSQKINKFAVPTKP